MKLTQWEYEEIRDRHSDAVENSVDEIAGNVCPVITWHSFQGFLEAAILNDDLEIIKPRTYMSLELAYWPCVWYSLKAACKQFVRVFKHSMNKHYKGA